MKPFSEEQTKARILVVDDKPENLHLLSDTLSSQGYDIKGVINGKMALMVANAVVPDLILLDVVMPEMNGYQVCQQLKANKVTKDIPIIFLSASNNSEDRVKALTAGGVDYINKPFQINEVLLRINNQLQLQAARREILKFNTELEVKIQERTAQLEAANRELQQEITERHELTKLLRQSEEKLESILNSLEEVVWSADVATNNLLFLNPAAQKVYGRPVAELLANPNLLVESIHPEDRDRLEPYLDPADARINDIEYRIVQPDGEIRWVWERSRLIYDDAGTANRRDGIISDITERKKIESELSYEAKHDSLTNLPNRSAFIERVQQALYQSQQDPEYLFAVMFVDLDRFKTINDSLGHLVGDELLIAIAQILLDCSRKGDFVARLGGDEFTILLDRIQTITEADAIARRINDRLTAPLSLQSNTVFTSASIGIVLVERQYRDIADILRDADLAMYRAKSLGKARHEVFYPEMYAETKEQLQTENDLRKAILQQEFVLHYQPIISLNDNKLYGFEALLRWNHADKGLIYPDKFIPIAEETGLIVAIGEWVMQEACRQMQIWQDRHPNAANLKICLNVASQQIKDPNFLAILDRIIADSGLSGSSLDIEITETTLMENRSETISLFRQIGERKIGLSIDDFGTGYSSLQYLKRFPLDILKIDRSFVQGMLSDRENFEIVKMIIALARTLKIKIVAEGIEDLKQLKVLKTLHCQLGQGYLFSKPLESQSAELLIEN